jgi:hypothetical protein
MRGNNIGLSLYIFNAENQGAVLNESEGVEIEISRCSKKMWGKKVIIAVQE